MAGEELLDGVEAGILDAAAYAAITEGEEVDRVIVFGRVGRGGGGLGDVDCAALDCGRRTEF